MGGDDEERGGDGRPVGGDPFSLGDLVVPNDARELDADLRALRRERRAEYRRVLLRRVFLGRRWQRYGVSGPIVIGVLLVVAGFASLMLLFQPRRAQPAAAPLASRGVRGVGEEGGLLPGLSVQRANGDLVPLRSYRPALIALLPSACGCAGPVQQAGSAALRHHVPVLLVGTQLPPLPDGLPDASVSRALDTDGSLARIYHVSRDPVLLLVRDDGVVNRILGRISTSTDLDGELAVLVASDSWTEPG